MSDRRAHILIRRREAANLGRLANAYRHFASLIENDHTAPEFRTEAIETAVELRASADRKMQRREELLIEANEIERRPEWAPQQTEEVTT